jgi:hypothetical protein
LRAAARELLCHPHILQNDCKLLATVLAGDKMRRGRSALTVTQRARREAFD